MEVWPRAAVWWRVARAVLSREKWGREGEISARASKQAAHPILPQREHVAADCHRYLSVPLDGARAHGHLEGKVELVNVRGRERPPSMIPTHTTVDDRISAGTQV